MAAAKRKPQKTAPTTAAETRIAKWRAWSAGDGAIDDLCGVIATGTSLNAWIVSRGFVYMTVRNWIEADEVRAVKYARAREDRADKFADEIVAISDELTVITKIDGEDVSLALDATAVARNRLRVDARKWAASKLKPKAYGDRTVVAGDPDAPLVVTHAFTMTDDQLLAIAAGRSGV